MQKTCKAEGAGCSSAPSMQDSFGNVVVVASHKMFRWPRLRSEQLIENPPDSKAKRC